MQLSLAEARRIALAAQGFDRPRPRRPTARDLAGAIRRLALVQLDYVNVLVPSHYPVLFSRPGADERGRLRAVRERGPNLARRFDLAERVVGAEHHSREVERDEAERQLLLQAARAHGVAAASDLADYFRMPVREARVRLGELAAAGKLRE